MNTERGMADHPPPAGPIRRARLVEMRYQFEEPFIGDGTKTATKLTVHAIPIDQALGDTLGTYHH